VFIHTTKVSNSALQYLSGVVRALRYISLHKIVNIIRLRISFHYSQITQIQITWHAMGFKYRTYNPLQFEMPRMPQRITLVYTGNG